MTAFAFNTSLLAIVNQTVVDTITASAVGATTVSLQWNFVPTGYTFNITQSASATGPFTSSGTSSVNNFTVTNLTSGDSYYFAVASVDSGGNIGQAVIAGPFTTTMAIAVPSVPQNVAATGTPETSAGFDGKMVVTWSLSTGAGPITYTIFLAINPAGPFNSRGSVNDAATLTVTNLL